MYIPASEIMIFTYSKTISIYFRLYSSACIKKNVTLTDPHSILCSVSGFLSKKGISLGYIVQHKQQKPQLQTDSMLRWLCNGSDQVPPEKTPYFPSIIRTRTIRFRYNYYILCIISDCRHFDIINFTSGSDGTEDFMYRTRNTYGVGTVKYHSSFASIDFSICSTCSLS